MEGLIAELFCTPLADASGGPSCFLLQGFGTLCENHTLYRGTVLCRFLIHLLILSTEIVNNAIPMITKRLYHLMLTVTLRNMIAQKNSAIGPDDRNAAYYSWLTYLLSSQPEGHSSLGGLVRTSPSHLQGSPVVPIVVCQNVRNAAQQQLCSQN